MDPKIAQQLAMATGGAAGSGPNGMPTQRDVKQAQEEKEKEEEMRADLLARILSADAKERLSRISLVKADKARKLENMVIQMARTGRLQSQLDDSGLKRLLEQISQGEETETRSTIKFDRRRRLADSDDEEIDLSDL